jgi:hypothetical protein
MKRDTGLSAAVLALCCVVACSTAASTTSSVSSLASNPLVSSLTSGLGLSANQAIGGAGAVLGAAQEKLSPGDWSKVAKDVPGADALVTQAKSMSGVTGKFGDLSSMGGTFEKLGLNSEQVSKLVPAVTDYVAKASPEVGNLLKGALM